MKKAMKAMVALLGAFVSLTVSSAWAAEPLTENITLMASETVEVTSGEAVALKWVAKPDELAGERLDVKVERQVDSSAKVTITANGTAAAAKPAVIALYGDNELVKTISVTITDKVDKNYMAENKTNGIERLVVNVKDARVIHVGETWEYTTATKGNGTWTISNHTDTYKSYNLSNFDSYFTIGGTTSTDNTSRNLKKNEDGTTTFSITGKDSAGDKALVFSIKDGNTEVMRVQVIVDGKYEDVKIKRGETVRKSGVYNSTGNDRRWAFDNDGSDANVVALAMKYGETSAVNTPLDECPYKSGFYQTKNWNQEFNADLTGKNLGSQLIRVARVNNSESSFSTMYQYNVFVYDEATDSIDCKAGDVITDKAFTSEKAGAWEATSSDPTVVTVTEAGWTDTSFTPVIKALKEGKATLTVKNNFITYTVTVNVAKGKEIKNISIEKDGEAYVDDTIAGGASASSDDEGVATITLNSATKATIAGVAAGDAVCTVKDSASNPIYEYNVKVYETKTADALVATGKTATVSLMSAKPAVWTAKAYDETVVQVLTPSSGEATDAFSLLLKGLDVGSTTVSVENDYVKYAVTVTVSGDVKKMDLAVETGKTVTTNLTFASAVYWVATPASDDDADVMTVSVDEERKSAAMTATIETLKPGLSQWTVYVKESENGELVPAYAMSVKVWKAAEFSISLQPEESVTTNLTSAAQDSWTAESSAPAVATVTATGASSTEFAPTITALADGETTITAKNGYAVYTIHVKVRTIIPVSVPTAEDLTYTGLEQTGVIASEGYTLTGNVGTNAGNYTATAKLVDGYCWDDKSTTDKTIDWSIAKKPVTVTGDSTSKVYGAADPTLTATVVGTNGFDGAEIAYTIAREEGNDVGTYDIVVTVDDADQGNYTVSGGTAADAFEITRAPIARPAAKTDLVYNGGCQTGVVAAAGFAVADNAATNAGTYTATATLDGNHMWTGGSTDAADVNFTIAPAEIEVKADNKTVKLDASVPDYTYTVSPALFGDDKLEGSLACAYDPNSGTNKVGMVFDILQGTLTNANYTITSFTKGTLTIASLQVELEPAGRTYDGTAFPSNSITFKVTDNDGNTITDFSVAGTNSMFDAGTYTFKVTTADGLEGSADFVVSQALVKVTAASTNKVYSGSKATDPEFMATVEGLVNGEGEDLIEYTLARVEGENVGEYAITPSGDASQGNYKIEFVSATFTIFPKDVTVTANSATKTYGDNDPEFTATVVGTNGTDGVTIQYKFTRDEGDVATNATPYVIRPVSVNVYCTGNVETQRNYVVTYDWSDSARLTIDRKSVTVTIASTNLVYGDVYPDWESSVDNLPYGDKLDYTLAPLNCNGDASETAYVIAPVSYNTNGNYIVNFVNGELTIERRPILVTVVATNKVYSGDAATDPTFTYVVSNAEGTAELKVLPNGTDVVLNGWLVRTAGEDVKDSPYDVDTLTYFNETNNPNYLFEEKLDGEDKFTILPAAVLVQADDKSKLFGWDDPEWTATVTGTNGTDGVKIDYTVKCDHGEAVGKYPIVVSGKTPQGGLNYDITCSNGWFEICAGKMSVTTNGVTRGYDDIDAAFAALLEKGGKAFFNADVTFGGSTFAKGSTLTVAEDGSWTTDGTLTLAEDICVGTVVAASNVVLTTDVTVGVTEEVTNELAVLTFKEIDLGENHLTLTTNGVVRSAKQLVIDDVFVEPSKAYEVIEKKITDGWEYTAVLHGFTITFNSNGGSPVDDIVAAAGETVEGPEENPTRTGYGFDGWYTNGVMKVEFPLTMPMADFTLDAHWTANDYKVAYDPNGGEGSATTNDATYDVAFKVADCTFAKEGYTFAGWTTNLASAVRFQPGDSVSNLTVTAGATVTMYAAWTANVYAVTYDPNGGSGEAATSNETYDVDFTVAGQPFTKEGHTYNSWTNAEGDVFLVGAVTNNLSTGEAVTLYAAWKPNGYTLAYTAGEGDGETVETNLVYDVKHTVIGKPDDFEKPGYSFREWTDEAGTAYRPGEVVVNLTNEPNAVVTWTAAWTANVYTITFDTKGGSEVEPITAACDEPITKPGDPTKTGYGFAGWATNGEKVVDFPTTMPAGGLAMVATWTANAYRVGYDPNGGTGEAATSNETYDVDFTVAGQPFTKEGHTYNSWTNAEGDVFLVGAVTNNLTAVKDGLVTLYAAWKPNGYTLAYTAGEGDGGTVETNLVYDVKHTVIGKPDDFEKPGYSFREWTDEAGTAYRPGEVVVNLTNEPNAVVTWTAAWTANVYAVTYDPNGGTGEAATSNETYDVDFTVAGQPFTKEGHTYNSWTNAEGDVFLVGAVTNNLSTGEAVTLYAKWNPITYRLVYTANGGEGENVERELTYDVAHKVIANPFTRKGYGFSGWIDGEGAAVTNQPGAFVKNLTNEQGAVVTWLAAWTAGLYTLTFDSNGGSEVDPIVAKAGKAISAPEDPMRAWYDFAGWTTNGVEVALFPTTMPGEDLTFVAQWTPAPGNPENPWSVGPDGSDAVEAYVEPDLGRVVIRLNETNEIDLVALTNALAQVREVEIVLDSFNAVIEIDEGAYMTPASWSDTRDVKDPYPTLGDALMGGTQFVSPNLSAEEPPAEIIEKSEVEVEGGKVVVAATVENDSANVESNAIQAVAVEGLVGIAEEKKTDVTLTVTAKTKDDVGEDSVLALDAVNTNGVGGVSSFETGYVDLSVYCGGSAEPEKRLGSLLAIHVARTIAPQCLYRVSRIHDGVAEAIPEYPQTNGDGEFFRVDALAGEIVFCVMNFSIYSVAEIETSAETDTYITVDDANGVREGTNIVVRVTGGRSAFSASAQLQVVYGSATASDLDLKNVKVNGALVSGFKFPYTLTWVNGEVWEQVIEIPVKVQSRARQNRDLTFALANPMNASLKGVDDPVANWSYRKVTILGASGPVSGKFCVRATPNDATRGKTSGSALVVPGKKVTVKATAQKDYVFTGWFEGEELKERAASYAFTPTADVDLVARFEPLAADFLELKDDFLPAEIELGKVFSNAVTVASGSLPTISVSGLPAGLKYYAKETVVRDTKAKTEYTVPANTIYGIPTKASATNKTTKAVTPSKVKVTVKNLGGYKIARTYELRVTARTAGLAAVVKDDVPFFAVSAALSDDAAGKVTGAKLYQAGKKVTLKATANKGYVFAGWYDTVPSASSPTDAGQLPRSTSASYAFTMPPSNVTLVAKFALPGEIPDPTGKNPWGVAVVRNNDFAGNVTGAGYYQVGKKVTLKATALKGYVFSGWYRDAAFEDRITQDASYVIAQMPAENVRCYARFVTAGEDLASIVTAANGTELFVTPKGVACLATNAMCGVDLRWPVVSTALSLPKVSVSGLPSGLKFTAKPVTAKVNGVTVTNVPANTIYGAPTAASSTDRATGLPKPSKVKVTVTTSGKSKAEYQLDLVVVALPDYAVGTFDGPVFAADGTTNGVVKLTVAKNGKISGTIQTNCVGAAAKKLSLSVASFAGYDLVTGVFALKPTYKDGKAAVEVPMTLADSAAVVGGKKVGVIDGESLFAYQNVLKGVAKADDFLAPDPMAKYPDLKLTVAKDGVLKVAGKVPDNSGKPISASASSQIYWDADEKGYRAVIYLPSKKGFDGVAEIIEVTENVSK